MFGFIKKADIVAEVKNMLKDEYMTQRIGIGKLEKAGAINAAKFGARLLTGYLGISPREVEELRDRSQFTAGQNLISYSAREDYR